MSVERAYRWALVASMLAWLALETWNQVRDLRRDVSDAVDRDRRSVVVMVGLSVIAVVSALVAAPLSQGSAVLPWRYDPLEFAAGMVLLWAGLGLRVWSITSLGTLFHSRVLIRRGHRVVRDGPYRVLRHPSYAGALLTGAGVGILLGSWISLAVMLVLPLAGYLHRMRIEEAALTRELGEPYADYARRTWRLIPFVW
jgi:protein-S-isoprenylcysteine O-methyltransferase Ste14